MGALSQIYKEPKSMSNILEDFFEDVRDEQEEQQAMMQQALAAQGQVPQVGQVMGQLG